MELYRWGFNVPFMEWVCSEPENDRYYIDYDNMDLRSILCAQVDCDNIPLSDKELGIVEPMK